MLALHGRGRSSHALALPGLCQAIFQVRSSGQKKRCMLRRWYCALDLLLMNSPTGLRLSKVPILARSEANNSRCR